MEGRGRGEKYRKIEQNQYLLQPLGSTNLRREENELGLRKGRKPFQSRQKADICPTKVQNEQGKKWRPENSCKDRRKKEKKTTKTPHKTKVILQSEFPKAELT